MEEEIGMDGQVAEGTQDNSENLDGAVLTTAQVNKIVQSRLQQQKKAHDRALQQLSGELEAQTLLVSEYEEALTQILESQVGDLPEPLKELFDKLPTHEKLEWVKRHGQSEEVRGFEKQTIPATPRGAEAAKKFKPNTKNVFRI